MLVEPGGDGVQEFAPGFLTSGGKGSFNLEPVIGGVCHEATVRAPFEQ